MAEPFGFFQNSPLDNFSGTASGNGEGFPRPPEPPIVSNSMDLRMLFKDILESYEDYHTSTFYFNPKKYHVPWKKQIEMGLSKNGPIERISQKVAQAVFKTLFLGCGKIILQLKYPMLLHVIVL